MSASKQAVIARDSPYSWKYVIHVGLVGQPRLIRHWVRQPPKNEKWLVQVAGEIAALKYALSQRGYIVTVKEGPIEDNQKANSYRIA